MTSLHVGGNRIPEKEMRKIMTIAMKILCEIPFKDKTLTELDVSGKNLGMEGALVIAEYLDGNRAISSVNILKNHIPVEQAKELVAIMQSKEKLATLCGLSGEETELDFSNQNLRAGDAVLIANDISNMRALVGTIKQLNIARHLNGTTCIVTSTQLPDDSLRVIELHSGRQWVISRDNLHLQGKTNGALTLLDISDNELGATGGAALAAGLKGNQVITEINIASNYLGLIPGRLSDMSGVIALTDAMKDMGAMTKFDISDNVMRADGCKAVAGALKGNTTLTELNIAKNGMTYGDDMSAIITLADVIPDMRALTRLDISNNNIRQGQGLQQITECCSTKGIELASNAQ
jgi:Leucine-rich repeat (LRR) protein